MPVTPPHTHLSPCNAQPGWAPLSSGAELAACGIEESEEYSPVAVGGQVTALWEPCVGSIMTVGL